MSRKIWLVLAIAALVAASFAASVVAAKQATEDRPKYVTRGLDYLHCRQGDNGGFGNPENTAWAVLGAVASGERMGNSAWHVKGKNPFDYLQSTDLVAASTSIDVTNAPVYYSRLIMAYVAMDRAGTIGTAGSKGINLLTVLLSYQNTTDGSSNKGAFAPSLPSLDAAVRTTSWAILAMHNAGVSRDRLPLPDGRRPGWPRSRTTCPAADGGFPSSEQGGASDALDTALAYQALDVSSDGTDWDPGRGPNLPARPPSSPAAGFPATAGRQHRRGGDLRRHPGDPRHGRAPRGRRLDRRASTTRRSRALEGLLQTNGSYRSTATTACGPSSSPAGRSSRCNRKPFTTNLPQEPGHGPQGVQVPAAVHARSRPRTARSSRRTRIVLIRATYTDFYPKGTGIKPSAVRVYVDNANKSRPADIGRYGLHLQLKNVPNGDHTYTIELRDHAGNAKVIERKFTVAVATPTPHPTRPRPGRRTIPTGLSDRVPHAHADAQAVPRRRPRRRRTPTVTPYPYDSPTPRRRAPSSPARRSRRPAPRPAPPASAAAAAAVVPPASWVVPCSPCCPSAPSSRTSLLHRREELLGTASQGDVLAGGGSAWERFKQHPGQVQGPDAAVVAGMSRR